jgi:predicted Zn finger-like uncharacterized protein
MSFTTVCPHCDARQKASDESLGEKLRCKKCDERFIARKAPESEIEESTPQTKKPSERPSRDRGDDTSPRGAKSRRAADGDRPARRNRDEEDDEPPRKAEGKGKKKRKSVTGLLVLVGVGALFLIGGGIGVYFAFFHTGGLVPKAASDDQSAQKMPAGPGAEIDREGKFAIKFPGKPNRRERTIEVAGVEVKAQTLDFHSINTSMYLESVPLGIGEEEDDPEKTWDWDQRLAKMVRGAQATVTSRREVTHQGVRGRELTVSIPEVRRNGVIRFFLHNKRSFTLYASGPNYQADTREVVMFFESLRFLD